MSVDPETIQAARAVLPAWVGSGWSNLLPVPLFGLLSFCATSLALRFATVPLRRHADAPWYERARLSYGVRWRTLLIVLLLSALSWVVGGVTLGGPLSALPGKIVGLLTGVASFVGAVWASLLVLSEIHRRTVRAGEAGRDLFVFVLLFLPTLVVAALLATISDDELGFRNAAFFSAGIAAFTFFVAGGSVSLLRLLRLLRSPSPRLTKIADRAASRTGILPSRVYEIVWSSANAVAFPISREIAVTRKALEILDDAQLESVCVHELAHLTERWPWKLAHLATQFVWLPLGFPRLLVRWWGTPGALATVAVVLIVFILLILVRRRMELRSDAAGTRHETSRGTYAMALEKLYRANLVPVVHGRASHPPLYDRMIAAGVEPSYPRPKEPPNARARVAILLALLLFVFFTFGELSWLLIGSRFLPRGGEFATAVTAGSVGVERLAGLYAENDEPSRALPLYRFALESEQSRSSPNDARIAFLLRSLASIHRQLGDPDKAAELEQEARAHEESAAEPPTPPGDSPDETQ